MKKILIGLSFMSLVSLFSCEQNSGAKYQAINRQKAILLVDQNTGEVFMMELIMEKGKGVVGSNWKQMGDPSDAK